MAEVGREAERLVSPLTPFTAFDRADWQKCRLRPPRSSPFSADGTFKAGKGGEGVGGLDRPTCGAAGRRPDSKQPAMQARQTRTADGYPHRAVNLCPLAYCVPNVRHNSNSCGSISSRSGTSRHIASPASHNAKVKSVYPLRVIQNSHDGSNAGSG